MIKTCRGAEQCSPALWITLQGQQKERTSKQSTLRYLGVVKLFTSSWIAPFPVVLVVELTGASFLSPLILICHLRSRFPLPVPDQPLSTTRPQVAKRRSILFANELPLCSCSSHGFHEIVKYLLTELDSSPATSRAALTTVQIGCFIRHKSLQECRL